MSYTIGIIRPSHPDAQQDGDQSLIVSSFTGPGQPPFHDIKWLQLDIGKEFIRLSHPQILALYTLLEQRLKGTDQEMIDLSNHIEGGGYEGK